MRTCSLQKQRHGVCPWRHPHPQVTETLEVVLPSPTPSSPWSNKEPRLKQDSAIVCTSLLYPACLHYYRNGTCRCLLHILFSACSLWSSETLSCCFPITLDHVTQHKPLPRFTLPSICLFTALLLSIPAHLIQDSRFPFLPPSGYPFECLWPYYHMYIHKKIIVSPNEETPLELFKNYSLTPAKWKTYCNKLIPAAKCIPNTDLMS